MPTRADRRHINRLPGRNVAEWLGAELARRGHEVGELGEEDFGWYLPVTVQARRYNLVISAVANAGEDACDGFVCVFELQSLIGQLLARMAGRSNSEATEVLEEILSGAKHVRDVRWFASMRDVAV